MRRVKYNTLSEAFLNLDESRMYHYIIDSKNEVSIQASEFKHMVLRKLQILRNQGLHAGDELLFQIQDAIEFTCTFWACILGAIVPIPYAYLESERDQEKLLKIVDTLKNPHIISDRAEYDRLMKCQNQQNKDIYEKIENKILIIQEDDETIETENVKIETVEKSDVAFIQFSSGSTSDPKGIMLSHINVIESTSAVMHSCSVTEKDVYVSWLPLSHNFGLVGTYLTPLLAGCEFNIMPTNMFIKNPMIWIQKMSEHKATISASPNFGFKRVNDYASRKQYDGIDLSSLRMIFDGAEHISQEVCSVFTKLMMNYGMKQTVVMPSYGLTESTLTVSVPKKERGVVEIYANREHVSVGEKIIEQKSTDENSICFIDVGEWIDPLSVKIVDDGNNILEECVVGHLLIKGIVLFKGYYNNEELTKKVIDNDGWFDTGDLGFIRNGRLVITGRAKDMVIINGENFYLSDIEQVCQEAVKGKVDKLVLCEIISDDTDKSQLACFLECTPSKNEYEDLVLCVKKQALLELGIPISWVIPVEHIPLTSSGKVQRFLLADQFKHGKFDAYINQI